MQGTPSRREFLANASIAGMVLGGYQATAAGYRANETIEIGCIGTGGRWNQLMDKLLNMPGVRVSAVCDVWDMNLDKGKSRAARKAFATKNHEALLRRRGIDAVLIATPDHLHVPLTVDACAAGKDVYVEKPLTHSVEEGAAVIDAQHRYRRVVQVGMQQRSMPHLNEAKDIVASGTLGPVRKVHLTWNRNSGPGARRPLNIAPESVDWKRFLGPAPAQPFDGWRFRNWRFFWDFGGGIFTDLMVHFIDVAHWYLQLEHPMTAASIGSWYTHQDAWETPDTVQTLLHYAKPDTQVYFEGTFYNARNAAMIEFMGSEATLYCDRGRYEIHPEPGRKLAYKERILGSGGRGQDFYDVPDGETLHLANWLECIRTRQTPNAPAEAGVSAAAAAHLANRALRTGSVAHWEA